MVVLPLSLRPTRESERKSKEQKEKIWVEIFFAGGFRLCRQKVSLNRRR
jgi:hypothetical protein